MLGADSFQGSSQRNFQAVARRWSWWVGAGVALVWLSPACLNPHTDDQPTFVGAGGSSTDVTPRPQAACDDNPLLAGCDDGLGGRQPVSMGPAASSSGGGAGSGGSAGSTGAAGQGGLVGSAGSGGMPAVERDAGAGDAGVDDAGAGDAGGADAP